jgi:hypothetical protein
MVKYQYPHSANGDPVGSDNDETLIVIVDDGEYGEDNMSNQAWSHYAEVRMGDRGGRT